MRNSFELIPALITPFDLDGGIMENALLDIIDLHISQGVKTFYILGSTAECHLMTLDERMRVAELVREKTKGRARIICQIGTTATEMTLKLARHAQSIGADMISATPPFYYKYSLNEILGFYKALSENAELPMLVYHIPSLTGVSFAPEDMNKLAAIKNIAGVKYSHQNMYDLERMARTVPEFKFYYGHDEALLASLPLGVDGAIGSTYNFLYPKASDLADAYFAGDAREALKHQNEINDIIATILGVGNLQSTKYLMKAYGLECGVCRMPMKRLSKEDEKKLDGLLSKII